jgi:RNA polymerase-associated protein
MAITTNKRSVMTLYSGALDVYSHRVRIVLAEKGVSYDVMNIENNRAKSEDLFELNPYGTIPTLVDRELALYESTIIMEYLDERFPHPPLMPVYPVARAKARLVIHRFDREWGPLIRSIESGKANEMIEAVKELTSYLIQLLPLFTSSAYFLGDEFTLVDCCIAPILWRLPSWGVMLSPDDAKAVNKYTEKVFRRDSFQASLSEAEHELGKLDKVDVN